MFHSGRKNTFPPILSTGNAEIREQGGWAGGESICGVVRHGTMEKENAWKRGRLFFVELLIHSDATGRMRLVGTITIADSGGTPRTGLECQNSCAILVKRISAIDSSSVCNIPVQFPHQFAAAQMNG